MMFVDELRQGIEIVLHPIKETRKGMQVGEAIRFFYKLSLIPTVLSVIVSVVLQNKYSSFFDVINIGGGLFVWVWIVGPLIIILLSVLLHFIGKILFKSFKNKYNRTFTAVVYAEAPVLLLSWLIPILRLGLGSDASVISAGLAYMVLVCALSNQQNVNVGRAFGIVLATIFVIIVVALAVLWLYL